jgi:hypothetical protein
MLPLGATYKKSTCDLISCWDRKTEHLKRKAIPAGVLNMLNGKRRRNGGPGDNIQIRFKMLRFRAGGIDSRPDQ